MNKENIKVTCYNLINFCVLDVCPLLHMRFHKNVTELIVR